jgi:hypothetical protein
MDNGPSMAERGLLRFVKNLAGANTLQPFSFVTLFHSGV